MFNNDRRAIQFDEKSIVRENRSINVNVRKRPRRVKTIIGRDLFQEEDSSSRNDTFMLPESNFPVTGNQQCLIVSEFKISSGAARVRFWYINRAIVESLLKSLQVCKSVLKQTLLCFH